MWRLRRRTLSPLRLRAVRALWLRLRPCDFLLDVLDQPGPLLGHRPPPRLRLGFVQWLSKENTPFGR